MIPAADNCPAGGKISGDGLTVQISMYNDIACSVRTLEGETPVLQVSCLLLGDFPRGSITTRT